MAFHPYLNFGGNCRAAFTRYHEIFGGQLDLLPFSEIPDMEVPAEQADAIMHAALTMPDGHLIMGSDDPSGGFAGVAGAYVNFSCDDTAEAERVWKELTDGAEIQMPLDKTFWSPAFGMLVDRFGTPWMVNTWGEMQQSS